MRSLELVGLLDHMSWADAVLWDALLAHEAAREDTRIRELSYHVHTVQAVYLQLCRSEPVAPRPITEFPTLESVYRYARELDTAWGAFLASGPETGRQVQFPWAEQLAARFGRVHDATLAEALLQVTSHSTYHRGQLNARLRELGGEPPLVDFIAWVWAGKPPAEWAAR